MSGLLPCPLYTMWYTPCDFTGLFIMWYHMVYHIIGISHSLVFTVWYSKVIWHDISHKWYITPLWYTMWHHITIYHDIYHPYTAISEQFNTLSHVIWPPKTHVISHFLGGHITWYITLTWTHITSYITKVWYITFWVWCTISAPSRWQVQRCTQYMTIHYIC